MTKEKDTDRHGQARKGDGPLIPKHGGYRRLKTFQLAELIYDVTVRFCNKYVDPHSRTHDQMVQAARSGRQNIAEGSVDSGTSKKMEMKLTGVAKGSQEELRLDYEDFLRQRGLPKWEPNHPALLRFKALRCATLEEFRAWVGEEMKREREDTDKHGPARTGGSANAGVRESQCRSVPLCPSGSSCRSVSLCPSVFVANGALSLLNLCIYLLDKQMKAQAATFEKEGGFTERLYRRRSGRRQPRNN